MEAHGGATAGRQLGGLIRVLAAAAALGTLGPVAAVAYGEGVVAVVLVQLPPRASPGREAADPG